MYAGGLEFNNYSYWYATPNKTIVTLFSGRVTQRYLRLTEQGIDAYGEENDPCIQFKVHGTNINKFKYFEVQSNECHIDSFIFVNTAYVL